MATKKDKGPICKCGAAAQLHILDLSVVSSSGEYFCMICFDRTREYVESGHWVFDSLEWRAWGPFDTLEEAEEFQKQDKYLLGSTDIFDNKGFAVARVKLYDPAAYKGTMEESAS